MKALVADKFEQSGIDGLMALGFEVLSEPDLQGDELGQRIKESQADVLIVRSTKVTDPMMEGSRLSVIIRAGAGYNTIDVDAASRYGIRVANCPGKNSQAVAELAFGLMLALDRRIPDNVSDLRNGVWNKKEYSRARGLHGKTLGLIGMGNISQEMIPRAKAFGMYVVSYSRWMTPETAAALGIGRASTMEELAFMSDVVSVHVSLNPATKGILNRSFFEKMRPGSIVLNTSRAEVIDQEALLWAVKDHGLYAGLDVFEGEPAGGTGTYDGVLKGEPNVYCTHHIGASTEQAQEAIAAEVVRICREFKMSGNVPNVVNIQRAEVATHVIVIRHLDRVGVLAHILGVLKDEGVNVQEMENIVLGGAKSAIAQISVDKEPTPQALLSIKMNPNVFDASVFGVER
jgi:D-3-phosphoglycerate dehydrogenase